MYKVEIPADRLQEAAIQRRRRLDEERKKIKRVDSDHNRRREIKNWKKVWSEHTNDYDEVDEFYGRR